MKTAIVPIDYINEICHPKGKLSAKGYPVFLEHHGILKRVNEALRLARDRGFPVFWARVSFSSGYGELPLGSPLFGKAQEFGALKAGTWATEFHEALDVKEGESIIEKRRVSPFFGTDLEVQLRARGIERILLAGVATDLAVESAARDAHDRDFAVTVLRDCCGAATIEDHEGALASLAKISNVTNLEGAFGEA